MHDPLVPEATLADSFGGKRVLVTGHTGFKGGWLCLWLNQLGAQVTGIALPPPPGPSFFEAVHLNKLIDHRIADIRDAHDFASACTDIAPDLIIHMAAQSLVRPSYADPVDTFATNVTGTAVVLDAARRMESVRGVIIVTSDKCYENREWPWPYREDDALGGADPYSASKGCAELVAASFRRSYFSDATGCQVATVRAGNVFGGGDWAVDRLIPDLVRATLAETPVTIRNPASIRPWQHVLEPLSGYLALGARLLAEQPARFADAWNFGPSPDAAIDVESLARRFQRSWGAGAARIGFGQRGAGPHEAGMLTVDSSKARTQLGWRPRLAVEEAIDLTAQWYRSWVADRDDMARLTAAQIAGYEGRQFAVPVTTEKLTSCA